MYRFNWICALILSASLVSVQAQGDKPVGDTSPVDSFEEPVISQLGYIDAVALGLVEGITEYLPVSSTGHLILTNALLGLNGDAPIFSQSGEVILVPGDTADELRPYTIGEAAFAYIIVIQAGAIAAVLLLYRSSIIEIILGCLGNSSKGRKLALNLIVAFLPAAFLGLLLNDWIEDLLGENVLAVAAALIVGAIVMLYVERRRKRILEKSKSTDPQIPLEDLRPSQAFLIGCCQCAALWPGTSRSMATIVGGYFVGLSPAKAAEFSFLLGLLTLSAASGYTFLKDGSEMMQALQVGPVLVGCFVAFISATLAVKWLVGFLNRNGLTVFAWYRIFLAILIFFQIAKLN